MRTFRPTFELAPPGAAPWPGDKIGGAPTGVSVPDWPVCADCARPMSLIGQFRHEDDRLDLGAAGRVLTLWQCEHDPGMCETWAAHSGANAATVVAVADDRLPTSAPDPTVVVHPEVVVTEWSVEDDGVSSELRPSFFDDAEYLALGEEWWGRGGFDTRLGGVPAWIQSASEAPGPPWEFVGQLADSQRIGGAVPPSQLPGAGIQRRVDGAFRLEPPDGLAVEQVDRWIVVDDTGSYVPGPNFGHGCIAYLFVDRSQDPPAALMFWQCG